jgi:hypothetical protein
MFAVEEKKQNKPEIRVYKYVQRAGGIVRCGLFFLIFNNNKL